MASTYSDLKIELIGTGDQTGTWGSTTNNNFSVAISEVITGSADVAFSSADVTLTLTDTNAAQTARNLRLNLTGTSGGARNLILGSGCQIEKLYLVNNGLADAVTVKNTTGTGIAIPAGKSMFVFNNGTNVVDVTTYLSSLTLGTALPIASGGTGSTSTTYVNLTSNVTGTLPVANGGTSLTTLTANNVILGNGTSAPSFVAPGTTGNVLTSNGTTWASTAPTGQTYPGAGIANSTGSAWGTSYTTTGSGTVVALATSPTLVTPVLGTPTSGNLSSCTADGTDAVGFRNIPQNSQSAAYTLVLTDSGKQIFHPSADTTARTWTIPANSSVAFPIGTAITFINQNGAGVITIAITSDTMRLAGTGTTGSRTLAANGIATCVKVTSTEWIISGTGLT
jgi:hypothetical protein